MSAITVAVEPVTVSRETAAEMLGISVSHFQRHVQPELRIVRLGQLRLVPVDELKRWAAARSERG